MLYLRNLSSVALVEGPFPWEFKGEIPPEVRIDKGARDAWINRPDTDHYVYSFIEGLNPNLRVSKDRTDGEGNPAFKLHAIVADYDASSSPELVAEQLKKFKSYPPNWVERTLSGNWRAVWLLEVPIIFPCHLFARHFFKTFPQFAFDPGTLFPAWDRPAFEAPERNYTNSCEWIHNSDVKIPADVSLGWLVQASNKFKWEPAPVSIPMEVLATKLGELFPKFKQQWPGEFVVGSQGPTFWVDASTSPKSAIVRESGLQTFSANAPKAFYTWKDLVGAEFCQQYESEALGRAVTGIFHDGKHYYRQLHDDLWGHFEKGDLVNHLKTTRGMTEKNQAHGSQVSRAIEYIQSNNRVVGAAPFIFRPSGLILEGRTRFLNTSTHKVLTPAPEPAQWGHKGQFPWLSMFFDGFFASDDGGDVQADFFFSWLSYFYRAGYELQPLSGQNIFIAGGAGVGKTLLNRAIIGTLVGGFAECGDYLMGAENFGSELFEVPLWVVDDQTLTASSRAHQHFSEMVKRMAANDTHRYHAKFRVPLKVTWMGRIVATCNDDAESVRIIPSVDISNLDKISLYRANKEAAVEFPKKHVLRALLDKELPHFARWLLDYKMPEYCVGDSRFGTTPYHDHLLLQTAKQSARGASFSEILDDWKQAFFEGNKQEFWEGTSFQLHKAILTDSTAEAAMKSVSVEGISRHLSTLVAKGDESVEYSSKDDLRQWRIYKHKPVKT